MVSLIFHWTIEHGNLMFFLYIFSVYRIWSDHAIPSSFVFALVILPHARIVSPGFLSLFFFSFRFVLFFLPTYVHHFHRCDNRFSFLSCVFPLSMCYARAYETKRKDARVSACVCFVSVNPYQIFFVIALPYTCTRTYRMCIITCACFSHG